MPSYLISEDPVRSLAEYVTAGGGSGIERARAIGPTAVIEEVRASGLRGRGGAGFPTGIKWRGLAREDSARKFVVCNAAEGEPGTYKDRWLLQRNPYQTVEGLAIAAFAVGAAEAYVGIKARFAKEVAALKRAVGEMSEAGMLGDLAVGIVEGPDDYLFGEEKALLEVIEGREPLPRLYPPYIFGLFAGEVAGLGAASVGRGIDASNPTVVNNVETLANVPHILSEGASWFQSHGTERSPGTMIFTISGDVRTETVVELELGTPLSFLVYGPGEGPAAGRRVKAAVSGVSNRPVPGSLLDVPLSFEGLASIGSGLGSGGFVVYDDSRCMVQVGAVLSEFLAEESCGQCPPCKLGCTGIAASFRQLAAAAGDRGDVDELTGWIARVTDANRCGLGAGQQALAAGIVEGFPEDIAHHLGGGGCEADPVPVPKLESHDAEAGTFRLDAGADAASNPI